LDNLSVQNAEENTTAVMGPKALQAKAVHMVRGLISLCSTFESLPEERTISMFLFYHDNVTPRDYEPECFSSVPDGASYISGKEFLDNAISLHLGTLSSRYHCMSMKVKARDENVREEEEHLDHDDDDDEGMSVGGETTIGEETQEDEAFEELPPWRKIRVQVCRAIVGVFSRDEGKYITVEQVADMIEVSRDVAVKVLEQMVLKKLVGRSVGKRGHRIYRNEHTRLECRVAKSALQGLNEDDETTQIDIDQLSETPDEKNVRSYRFDRNERNDPPFLQKAPSPRRVLQSQNKRTIPRNKNLKRNRIHGADWLETARNERGGARKKDDLSEIEDDDDLKKKEEEEKLEREMIGEFSQDSIFRELVDNRKSSSSSRPIYQYGRKKKRRRGLE